MPRATPAATKREPEGRLKQDSGFPIAIPENPAVDAADDDPPSTPSMNSMQEQALWGGATAAESPNLVEARAKMMEMLTDLPPSGRRRRS